MMGDNPQYVLELRGVARQFGSDPVVHALRDVDLRLERGHVREPIGVRAEECEFPNPIGAVPVIEEFDDDVYVTGVIRDVRVLCERAEVATRMENTLVAPYGVAGGRAGRTGRVLLNPGTPGERELPGQGDGIQLARGDLLRFETCGGGGWGDPLARDPVRVRQDVGRGFVTVRSALEDYGVVLEPATLEVDKQATDHERARRAGPVDLIDRGPGFAEAEARWRASVAGPGFPRCGRTAASITTRPAHCRGRGS